MKQRALLLLPSLVFVVTISFLLMHLTPGNELDKFRTEEDVQVYSDTFTTRQQESYWSKQLGLDLPMFYISLESLATGTSTNQARNLSKQSEWQEWVPVICFHSDNRFHRWLFGDGIWSAGILHGDFGISQVTKTPVGPMVYRAMLWSGGICLFSLLLSFLISVPAGLYMAAYAGAGTDRVLRVLTLVLMTMPAFWLGTFLLVFFANPDLLDWFPASGTSPARTDHPGILLRIQHLVLPITTYTLSYSAFLIRSIRDAALTELSADHIRTAKAKGQSTWNVMTVHVLRNRLPSLLALLGNILPIALSGSVIIESIFGITTGMGALITTSVSKLDYPVLSAIFLLTAVTALSIQFFIDVLIVHIDRRTSGSLLNE